MRRLLSSLVAPLVILVPSIAPPVASAHAPVFWNNCRSLQWDATLAGRPATSIAHFCSARQQLAPQDLTDANALRRAGDADLAVLDQAGAFFSDEFPSGELHSIGDVRTYQTGTNAFGKTWRDYAWVYVVGGGQCLFIADAAPGEADGVPSLFVTFVSHTCT